MSLSLSELQQNDKELLREREKTSQVQKQGALLNKTLFILEKKERLKKGIFSDSSDFIFILLVIIWKTFASVKKMRPNWIENQSDMKQLNPLRAADNDFDNFFDSWFFFRKRGFRRKIPSALFFVFLSQPFVRFKFRFRRKSFFFFKRASLWQEPSCCSCRRCLSRRQSHPFFSHFDSSLLWWWIVCEAAPAKLPNPGSCQTSRPAAAWLDVLAWRSHDERCQPSFALPNAATEKGLFEKGGKTLRSSGLLFSLLPCSSSSRRTKIFTSSIWFSQSYSSTHLFEAGERERERGWCGEL